MWKVFLSQSWSHLGYKYYERVQRDGNMFVSTTGRAKRIAGVLKVDSSVPKSSLEAFLFLPQVSVLPALQSSSRKVAYPNYGGSAHAGLLLRVKC